MGVVRRDQKTSRDQLQVLAFAQSQALPDAPQHILQKGGSCALFRTASHLFIVEHHADIDVVFRYTLQKRPGRCVCALQIIQSGRKDKVPVFSQYPSLVPDIEKQVMPQNPVCFRSRRFGNPLHKHMPAGIAALLPVACSVQRKHVYLRIVLSLGRRIPAHMNCQAGDHHQIFLNIDQSGLDPFLPLYHHTTCHGQRSVQPAGKYHSAVFFRI